MFRRAFVSAFAVALAAQAAAAESVYESSAGPLLVEEAVGGLDQPWGFVFLPGGPDAGVLITEKGGSVRLFQNGELSDPIPGGPEVADRGQGGLLDVALAQDFETSGLIFLSYAAPDGVFAARTEVARARLAPGPRLEDLTVIFRQNPSQSGGRHFGSRIVVAEDGSLFVTIGDRGEDEEAQNLAAHQGSLIRITADGAPHPENPYLDQPGAQPEIWSFGHRNAQGADFDEDGRLWIVEHGARGGDEINRPERGMNYGWPVISYGTHYSGFKIGQGTAAEGMEQPLHYWDPSIAPSGLAVYDGEMFPEWRGDLLVGALKFRLISRLDVE
ncbi:MAG: PQQ-dependent sugar dehydrogenase, partial [Pseudomonadota bacterium]